MLSRILRGLAKVFSTRSRPDLGRHTQCFDESKVVLRPAI